MSRDSRTILRFAATGAVFAAVFFAYLKADPPDNWITIGVILMSFVLCPGFIPFAWAATVEMDTPRLPLIWVIVTLINLVVYASVGAGYVKVRNWREETALRIRG